MVEGILKAVELTLQMGHLLVLLLQPPVLLLLLLVDLVQLPVLVIQTSHAIMFICHQVAVDLLLILVLHYILVQLYLSYCLCLLQLLADDSGSVVTQQIIHYVDAFESVGLLQAAEEGCSQVILDVAVTHLYVGQGASLQHQGQTLGYLEAHDLVPTQIGVLDVVATFQTVSDVEIALG